MGDCDLWNLRIKGASDAALAQIYASLPHPPNNRPPLKFQFNDNRNVWKCFTNLNVWKCFIDLNVRQIERGHSKTLLVSRVDLQRSESVRIVIIITIIIVITDIIIVITDIKFMVIIFICISFPFVIIVNTSCMPWWNEDPLLFVPQESHSQAGLADEMGKGGWRRVVFDTNYAKRERDSSPMVRKKVGNVKGQQFLWWWYDAKPSKCQCYHQLTIGACTC